MFGSFGMLEILLILVVGVVVFGVIKLPRFAKSVGAGWQELKRLKKGLGMGFDEEEPAQDRRSNRPDQRGSGSQIYHQQGPEQQYYGPAQPWQQTAPYQQGPSQQQGDVKKPPEDPKNA